LAGHLTIWHAGCLIDTRHSAAEGGAVFGLGIVGTILLIILILWLLGVF
jgi:hypothetical protein